MKLAKLEYGNEGSNYGNNSHLVRIGHTSRAALAGDGLAAIGNDPADSKRCLTD
jgi:hypothetical protein